MSRLESFIRRMQAQKECLNHVMNDVIDKPGIILEIGLGNGRTYDHLRQTLKTHSIYAFDQRIAAHPDCIPHEEFMILGDVYKTFPAFVREHKNKACLIHMDIGTGDKQDNRKIAEFISPLLGDVLQIEGLVLSDQELFGLKPLKLPENVPQDRYFIYQKS